MTARGDYAKAALTGLGLTFGLGWLWFPWLAATWLPGLLWGDTGSGGAGAFLLLLILGFGAGGIAGGRVFAAGDRASGTGRVLFRHDGLACHASAYILILAAFLLRLHGPRNLPGIWPYLALPAVVAAYAIAGLYWGGRVVSLPPAMAAAAFFVAAAAAAAVGQVVALLSLKTQLAVWPQTILIAMAAAGLLARMEKPQPKSRGRPPKREAEPAGPPFCFSGAEAFAAPRFVLAALAAILASVGFTDGAAWALYAGRIALPPIWLAGLCFSAGAFAPPLLMARLADPKMRGVSAALAVVAGTLFAAFAPSWSFVACAPAQCFVEGLVSALGLCLLANGNMEKGMAVRRAGLALAACIAAMNAGRLAGGALADMTEAFPAIIPAAMACAALLWSAFGPALGKLGRDGTRRLFARDASAAGEDGAFAGEKDGFLSRFTGEEARIVELLTREGLSNQEIADRLFVTRSTVRYHLKKIYAKTGTANREELAAFAATCRRQT